MKINLLILLLFIGLTNCQSQRTTDPERPAPNTAVPAPENPEIQVELHFRVDTTNKDVQEIVTLWTHYLNSEPDKISDNLSWNEEEKLKYEDFDLSRALLYQFPSAQLLRNYPPKVLSIEQEGEHYAIRTMYAAEGLEGDYRRSNPWAIQKLYAVRENNQWRLKNALPILTRTWNRRTIGKITYIYSPDHAFDEALAIKANEFCNRIATQFQFPDWAPFDYYIARDPDELGRLLNFDFFAAGYTTGIGFNAERMLLSGFGSEYYPHEFVHLVVPQVARHSLLEEGFATWQGGQGGKTFDETAQVFANALAQNDTVRFQDVVNRTWGWQYAGFYITGAILCHTAHQKGGIKLVNALLQIPPDDDRLVEHLCSVFGLPKKDFDGFWRGACLGFEGD